MLPNHYNKISVKVQLSVKNLFFSFVISNY